MGERTMMYRDATTRLVDDGWLAGCSGVGEEGESVAIYCVGFRRFCSLLASIVQVLFSAFILHCMGM
jgi:hypothetical protein